MEKTPPGTIIDGGAEERAAGDALGGAMAEQAIPGIMVTGKTVAGTANRQDCWVMWFTDGSGLRFDSIYGVRYVANVHGVPAFTMQDTAESDVIEGDAEEVDEPMVEHGRQLMSGD